MTSPAGIAALIVVTTFVSEDAAALTAATLSASGALPPTVGFASAALGIWLGDMGLYALGVPLRRLASHFRFLHHILARADGQKTRFTRSGHLLLFASRFVPGSRLPLYTAAGLTRYPFSRFAAATAIAVLAWVALLFAVTGGLTAVVPRTSAPTTAALVAITLIGALAVYRAVALRSASFLSRMKKYRHWEFWPAWIFYVPVVFICLWHALRYGSFSLPTIANLCQRNGGLIGESKFELLQILGQTAPESTPPSALIDAPSPHQRLQQYRSAMDRLGLRYPVVLKPDVGQRGQGFKKIANASEALAYLSAVSAPIVLQEYVSAPKEIGVFYYRLPSQAKGHIFAITEKLFPRVMGNGVDTLRELVEADERAALIAEVYLERLRGMADRIIPAGAEIRLVEAGNHCQGCVFKDGAHLLTPQLEYAIDRIAQAVPGFYVGRFDIRYGSEEELRDGRGLRIIELNGAASEATNIYDRKNSLWQAYHTLYRQWQLVYAIGAENHARMHRPAHPLRVLADWMEFRKISQCYPAAD